MAGTRSKSVPNYSMQKDLHTLLDTSLLMLSVEATLRQTPANFELTASL